MATLNKLDAIRDDAAGQSYPRYLLNGCDDALVLFAAGFHGRQDAYWIQEAGLDATCLDMDATRIREMKAIYPRSWEFIVGEAFEYITSTDRYWDLVSVDAPTGAFNRCASIVEEFCFRAYKAVVLGCGEDTLIDPPPEWEQTDLRKRSDFKGGVYWAVLERK